MISSLVSSGETDTEEDLFEGSSDDALIEDTTDDVPDESADAISEDTAEDWVYKGAEWYANKTEKLWKGIKKAGKDFKDWATDPIGTKEMAENAAKAWENKKAEYDSVEPGLGDEAQGYMEDFTDKDASWKEKVEALKKMAELNDYAEASKKVDEHKANKTPSTEEQKTDKDKHDERVQEAEDRFGNGGIPSSIQNDYDYGDDEP